MDEFCDAVIEISKEHKSILIMLDGSDGIAIPYRIKERLGEGRTIGFNLGSIGWLHDGKNRTIYFSTPTSFHLLLTAYHFEVVYVDAHVYREDDPARDLLNPTLEEGSSQLFTFDREKDFEVAWLNTLVKSSNKT